MKTKQATQISAAVFAVVALLHLWRAIAGLPANIGTISLPVWASYVAVVVAGYLAYLNYSAK